MLRRLGEGLLGRGRLRLGGGLELLVLLWHRRHRRSLGLLLKLLEAGLLLRERLLEASVLGLLSRRLLCLLSIPSLLLAKTLLLLARKTGVLALQWSLAAVGCGLRLLLKGGLLVEGGLLAGPG